MPRFFDKNWRQEGPFHLLREAIANQRQPAAAAAPIDFAERLRPPQPQPGLGNDPVALGAMARPSVPPSDNDECAVRLRPSLPLPPPFTPPDPPSLLEQLAEDHASRLRDAAEESVLPRTEYHEPVALGTISRRSDDPSSSPPPSISRACGVCLEEHPSLRAAYVECGHIVCHPCAEGNQQSNGRQCPFCRKRGGFVRLFE